MAADAGINWNARSYPGKYDPVQLHANILVCGCVDWWHTRSQFLCCLFPLGRCCAKGKAKDAKLTIFDSTDPAAWKASLSMPTKCPRSMKGVWWMCDNIAHETLVSPNDADWRSGNFNADGTTGVAEMWKPLCRSYSRPMTAFGYILAGVNGNDGDATTTDPTKFEKAAKVIWNFDLGKAYMNDQEWLYRIDEDEWQKVSYTTGDSADTSYNYFYRWRKLIRHDGTPTKHWDEYVARARGPVPHRNCCEPWCSCWSCCVSTAGCYEDATYPAKMQMTVFPDLSRLPASAQPAQETMGEAPAPKAAWS